MFAPGKHIFNTMSICTTFVNAGKVLQEPINIFCPAFMFIPSEQEFSIRLKMRSKLIAV